MGLSEKEPGFYERRGLWPAGGKPSGKRRGLSERGRGHGVGVGGMQSRIGGSSSGSERASRMRGLGSLERALWDRKGPPPRGRKRLPEEKGVLGKRGSL